MEKVFLFYSNGKEYGRETDTVELTRERFCDGKIKQVDQVIEE